MPKVQQMRPYEGSGDSQQCSYEPGRMDDNEHLEVFLQSVGQERKRQKRFCIQQVQITRTKLLTVLIPNNIKLLRQRFEQQGLHQANKQRC